jgi:hypothetical protein
MSTLLVASVLGAFVVWRFFQLGSETEALRAGLMDATHGTCEKKIAVHVGMFATALVRAGSRFFTIPPEPRAALESVHSVEFGIYELQEGSADIDAGAVLASTDKAMGARGWERCVGVVHEHQVVAVYLPRQGIRLGSLKCCLLVLESRNLVVLSARGNLEPLIALAQSKLGPEWEKHSGRVPFSANVASNQQ